MMSWFDKRITFSNLLEDITKNSLSKKEKSQVWTPRLVFENTKTKLPTLLDDTTIIEVKSVNVSDFTLSDRTFNEAVKQYDGEKNPMIMSRFYSVELHCEFQMQW